MFIVVLLLISVGLEVVVAPAWMYYDTCVYALMLHIMSVAASSVALGSFAVHVLSTRIFRSVATDIVDVNAHKPSSLRSSCCVYRQELM